MSLSSNRVFLIGFMGSGKSTLARALCNESSLYFLDTDAMIESRLGRSISEVFKYKGEPFFRQKEQELMAWLEKSCFNCVVSTGGGLPLCVKDLDKMGNVIYLSLPFEAIVARLDEKELKKRPLFQDKKEAKALYEARTKLYENIAHHTLDAQKSVATLLLEIKELLEVPI